MQAGRDIDRQIVGWWKEGKEEWVDRVEKDAN